MISKQWNWIEVKSRTGSRPTAAWQGSQFILPRPTHAFEKLGEDFIRVKFETTFDFSLTKCWTPITAERFKKIFPVIFKMYVEFWFCISDFNFKQKNQRQIFFAFIIISVPELTRILFYLKFWASNLIILIHEKCVKFHYFNYVSFRNCMYSFKNFLKLLVAARIASTRRNFSQ